ncbi:MAG: hypothetical protein U5J99_06085 [Parvularculaceae bacterium]|nr:hypothetical protein [Parvularculaceae bacterium]
MTPRRWLKLMSLGAASAALAGAPVFSAAAAADASHVVRAALCASGERGFIDIGAGDRDPQDRRRHAPCHAACLADRKGEKGRAGRHISWLR